MFNLANQLTLARIFFVVPIILLLYFPGKITCFLAAVLFGIASLTDFLDGHIARKGNMVTSFGKFLDPLADKLLICSILIMFVELGSGVGDCRHHWPGTCRDRFASNGH